MVVIAACTSLRNFSARLASLVLMLVYLYMIAPVVSRAWMVLNTTMCLLVLILFDCILQPLRGVNTWDFVASCFTEEVQKRKAANKQEKRVQRAEAKISQKKNRLYNKAHTFDFSETGPVGSEEGKSRKSGPGSVSQKLEERKSCYPVKTKINVSGSAVIVRWYCRKNGRSGLEAHKLKCKHPGNITVGSDDEEEGKNDESKHLLDEPRTVDSCPGGAEPRDIEEGGGSAQHDICSLTNDEQPRDRLMAFRVGGQLTYASITPEVQDVLRQHQFGTASQSQLATAEALCD